jgi:nucleoside-diphosphate-sugar epimerase
LKRRNSKNNLSGKKVLITGSTGFIGSNLARIALNHDADVYLLYRATSSKWRINGIFSFVHGYCVDLSDSRRLNSIISEIQPDIVYHTAAHGGNSCQKDRQRILDSNLMGTINMIDACRKVDLDIFVNTGSSSEYGIKIASMREDDLLEPVNDYGISKASATMYCQAAARNEGLPAVTLRLFSPYGSYEGQSRLVPSAILACLRGENPRISSRSFVRDFVFIDDVLDAYLKVIDAQDALGEIINIGYGEQHSVGEVVDIIIRLAGDTAFPVVGSPSRWPNEPIKWQADISKARNVLGWSPKYDLERGLAATVDWFKDNTALYR